jgi:hypothetical protein
MSAKFIEPSHFTDPDDDARKLIEIANAVEAVQDGRLYIERVNGPFPLLMTSLRVNFMYPWLMWPWRDRMTGLTRF